jgi:hypothetical protein
MLMVYGNRKIAWLVVCGAALICWVAGCQQAFCAPETIGVVFSLTGNWTELADGQAPRVLHRYDGVTHGAKLACKAETDTIVVEMTDRTTISRVGNRDADVPLKLTKQPDIRDWTTWQRAFTLLACNPYSYVSTISRSIGRPMADGVVCINNGVADCRLLFPEQSPGVIKFVLTPLDAEGKEKAKLAQVFSCRVDKASKELPVDMKDVSPGLYKLILVGADSGANQSCLLLITSPEKCADITARWLAATKDIDSWNPALAPTKGSAQQLQRAFLQQLANQL